MTVYELVTKLQDFPSDMTVALADWNEEYSEPCIACVDKISIQVVEYYNKDRDCIAITCVVIGEEP